MRDFGHSNKKHHTFSLSVDTIFSFPHPVRENKGEYESLFVSSSINKELEQEELKAEAHTTSRVRETMSCDLIISALYLKNSSGPPTPSWYISDDSH